MICVVKRQHNLYLFLLPKSELFSFTQVLILLHQVTANAGVSRRSWQTTGSLKLRLYCVIFSVRFCDIAISPYRKKVQNFELFLR